MSNVGNGRCADLTHDHGKFSVEHFQHLFNPRLAKSCQAPNISSANRHCTGAHREGFKDICTTPETAVDNNWNTATNGGDNFRQAIKRTLTASFSTTTMIRDLIFMIFPLWQSCSKTPLRFRIAHRNPGYKSEPDR